MNFYEKPRASKIEYNISDYEDTPFYKKLLALPRELATRCINKIETQGLEDDEAAEYIQGVLDRRKEVTTESEVSDLYVENFFAGQEDKIYRDIETSVFTSTENHIGSGMTARIKEYKLQKDSETLTVAVKYVVTPTEKTLSPSGEHDVIREVERIEEIEKMELPHLNRSKHIRVPHPYFHHKTDKIQCYGMERIEGADLREIMEGTLRPHIEDALKDSPLLQMDRNELFGYVERFFNTMHGYCIHGDIKPANIMLSTEGVLYVIDFGQSVMANEVTEKTADQFDVLKEDEIKMAKQSIAQAINRLLGVYDNIER